EGALGIADQRVAAALFDLEDELLDAVFFVHLEEALLRARPLVLDRLTIHVAEAKLEKLPDAVQVAPMDAPNAHDRAVRAGRRPVVRRFDVVSRGLAHEQPV